MVSQSRVRRGYILGVLGVIIALVSLLFKSPKDMENWFWITFTFLGGLYLLVRAWIADETG